MKINAISATMFGTKQAMLKKTALTVGTGMTALAADTFVKGISKPDKTMEEDFIRGNDSADAECCSCEACGDAWTHDEEYNKQKYGNCYW